jgi:sodium/hydrogen antiporter
VTILFLFGGAIAGGLLSPLTWSAALSGVAFLLVIRPLFGAPALVGSGVRGRERAAMGFFGVRGIGSFYYLAYGLNQGDFADPELIWATVGFVVMVSIVMHGIAGSPAMMRLDAHGEE